MPSSAADLKSPVNKLTINFIIVAITFKASITNWKTGSNPDNTLSNTGTNDSIIGEIIANRYFPGVTQKPNLI